MVRVLYFIEGQKQEKPIIDLMQSSPPRVGEKVILHTNQTIEAQKTIYLVEDVATTLVLWSTGEVKEVVLREIAKQGEVIFGGQGEVENP